MINRTENLLRRLLPEGVEQHEHELEAVLTSHFHSAFHDDERRVTLFPMHPPHALRLEYRGKLKLTGVFAEEALTENDIETVRAEFHRNFLESAGPGIGRTVLFVSKPLKGWWGYRDRFRIIPVPPEAPRPDCLNANHPFLLEFTYDRSPDDLVSGRRHQREWHRIALVLNSLVRGSITWHLPMEVGTHKHAWVILPNTEGVRNVAYCPICYDHASIHNLPDTFTPIGGLAAIPLVPTAPYYRPRYISNPVGLELPDDMGESFDLFFALSGQRQDRFLQASYWLNQANRVDSFSAMLLYTVQAVEALSWRPSRGQPQCPLCRKSQGPGVTQLFNAFLDRFAPEATEGRQTLYNVRSGLSHGYTPPFLVDTEVLFGLIPQEFEQLQLTWGAWETARIAMHNWLRDPGADEAEVA